MVIGRRDAGARRWHGAATRSGVPPTWTPSFTGGLGLLVAVVVGLGLYGSAYQLTLATRVAIYAIVILGLTVLVGYGGQISFGHNAFFGIGGYISALSTTSWGLSPVMGLLAGLALTGAVALVVGYPTLRLRGHFLALGTFAVGLGFYAFAIASPVFGGFTGIGGIPAFSLGPLTFDQQFARFWLCGFVLLIVIIAVTHLREGRWGRALRTVATDEATASSVGIDCRRMKLSAFVVSAVLASLAGSLYAHTTSYVSPETFNFTTILIFFMMLFIGGVGSVWGAVFGSLVITVVPELVPSGIATWQPTIFAVLLVAVLIARPSGLFSALGRRTSRTPAEGARTADERPVVPA